MTVSACAKARAILTAWSKKRHVLAQPRAGDAAVLDVLDTVRDDAHFTDGGQCRAQLARAVDEDDGLGQRFEVQAARTCRIEVEPRLQEGLAEPFHFQEILGDGALLEAFPECRIDGLVTGEQPVRDCVQAQFAQRAVERQLFGRLEVEQGIVEVEKKKSVFHDTGGHARRLPARRDGEGIPSETTGYQRWRLYAEVAVKPQLGRQRQGRVEGTGGAGRMGQEQRDEGDEDPDDDIAQRRCGTAHHVVSADEPFEEPGYVHDRPLVTNLSIMFTIYTSFVLVSSTMIGSVLLSSILATIW
jgi:hypothetical protein